MEPPYVFIDTAGIRRKSKIKEELERYSIIRTVTAVERADIVVVLIDAAEGVTEQDAKIAGIAHERGKGVIVAVNKWDAVEKDDKTIYQYTNKLKEVLSFMPYAEYIFISAATGQRLGKLFDLIDAVRQNQNLRVATGVLNEIITEAVAMQQRRPLTRESGLKSTTGTQVAVKPPTFVIFVNNKELMHFSYTRYLENQIRERLRIPGNAFKVPYPGTEGKRSVNKQGGIRVMERIVCLLAGYVFGLFQTGFIYGRMHGIDIRKYGSGNLGSTNALRVLGAKAGATVFAGDVLKI